MVFRGSTLIQVGYTKFNVTYRVFEQYSGNPNLTIHLQNRNSDYDCRKSKDNMHPPVDTQEYVKQEIQEIKQEQIQQSFAEKVKMMNEAKIENCPEVTKEEVELVTFEDEDDWSADFLAREDRSPCDDGFISPPNYGFEEELPYHQTQYGLEPLEESDHFESFKFANQEKEELKNQEES
ncbi:uncharacterized protein G2W53_014556 [Senna tora]|uniref:Uncharacterized protein n=1 Tax=Senna tora TaxID=362788 RepID=A0A834WTG8_9FABA|nr:uncharacterized protein G2W53_014556 [Senna tora]